MNKILCKLAELNNKEIYRLCIQFLYNNVDINYLKNFIKRYNLKDYNKDQAINFLIGELGYYIFSHIIKNANNLNNSYEDFIFDTDYFDIVSEYSYSKIKAIIYKRYISQAREIDFNKLSTSEKEKIVYKIIKNLILTNKISIEINNELFNAININKISSDNFMKDFIKQCKQSYDFQVL